MYGLYTSFIGVVVYPLFGTSKDISIGNLEKKKLEKKKTKEIEIDHYFFLFLVSQEQVPSYLYLWVK